MANLPVTPAGAPGRGPAGRRAHSPGDRAAERLGSAAPLVARVRHVHLEMVDAVLGDEVIGAVLMLAAPGDDAAPEFLHLAAVASLTEVAIAEARDEVEQNLRGSLLEELRSRPESLDAREIVRRARRLGCDLSGGGVALCARLNSDRPRHVVALITGEYPGALAQHMDGRVFALLPSVQDGAPLETQDAARRLAGRLERYGSVGLSSF